MVSFRFLSGLYRVVNGGNVVAGAVGGMSTKGGGEADGGDVVLAGYLKKLKTMRRKWFVLRAESTEASARLEYYDSEKKQRQRQVPKRSIPLRACFNINRRSDTKHKYVIALYTKDDCFCVVLDTERDLDAWLKALLSLQRGDDAQDDEPPRPHFGTYPNVAHPNPQNGPDLTSKNLFIKGCFRKWR